MVDSAGANLPRGSLSFTRDITGIPDAFAAFMLGIPLSANSAEGAPPAFIRQSKIGLYALDDFKVNNRLTLNFGLRWDWFGPVTDAQGKIRNLSFEYRHQDDQWVHRPHAGSESERPPATVSTSTGSNSCRASASPIG